MKKHFYLFCVYFGIGSCYSLKANDLNACVRKVEISDQFVAPHQKFVVECCPNYFEDDGRCKECQNEMYGDNCNTACNCPVHADCDSVSGKCTCHKGFFGEMCTLQECHQGYFDYNLNYNCSTTCVCNGGATCNDHSGICECKDKTSCINIKKKQCPRGNTSTIHVNRNVFIVLVTISVSNVCVLLVYITYLLLGKYSKNKLNQSSEHNVIETHIGQGLYNERNHYSEIRDDQLQDTMRTSPGMIENVQSQYRFQQTTNKEQIYHNNAQSLPNLNQLEEQYLNPYCSLQHVNEDYLNPYCALRFDRRVNSCVEFLSHQ